MTIYGTRPEAIKVAPVVKGVEADPRFESILVNTGQHRGLLQQVNQLFSLKPDHDLDVFGQGQGLNQLTSKVFGKVDPLLDMMHPDVVVVQGDTSTVAAAALATFNRGIPLVHLEAGLRSGNLWSPFPEEANRRVVSQIASLHLAPTAGAKRNLLANGIHEQAIVVTGNTVIDALRLALQLDVPATPEIRSILDTASATVLVTIHRRENWAAIDEIAAALKDIAEELPVTEFILPLHGNPAVREPLTATLSEVPNFHLVDAVGYGDLVRILDACEFVITDSGGIQEEAPSLAKPVFVVREDTERPEAVEAGTVLLVGNSRPGIVGKVLGTVRDSTQFESMKRAVNPYGDGRAAPRSIEAIAELLGVGSRIEEFAG